MLPACNICDSRTNVFSAAQILSKYDITYYICASCGFVQTETPFWLEESYSEAINRTDVGLVERNIRLSKVVKGAITLFFRGDRRFIDYGGGYGMFVRLMRDAGYNFYRYDKFCKNLFAYGFDADTEGTKQYELLTAFELLEHLVDPVSELKTLLSFSDNILLTTELLPTPTPKPEEWWYYGLDHGQHVSFFTRKSLELLATKNGLHLCSAGSSYHLLTKKKLPCFPFKALMHSKVRWIINCLVKRKSLTWDDYLATKGGL